MTCNVCTEMYGKVMHCTALSNKQLNHARSDRYIIETIRKTAYILKGYGTNRSPSMQRAKSTNISPCPINAAS